MPKEPKNSMYNKLNVKDILVIILSIVALVVLILVVKHSNEETQRLQEELNQISSSVQEGGLTYEEEDALSYLQFSEIGQEGFVEFTNTGNRNVSVSGYKLVANGEEILLAEGTIIAPDQFLVIAMKKAFPTDSEIIVQLYDAQDNLIQHIEAPVIKKGYSYAQLSTTNLEYGILEPTRGQWNGYLLTQEYEELTFSVPSGCYNEDFYLSLYAPEGSSIYYTLDGTKPTEDSEKYTEPILMSNRSGSDVVYAAQASAENGTYLPTSITKATVVNAICVSKGGAVSEVFTNTYLMGLKYSTALLNIPIVSITIEPDDMFDYYDGLYIKGRNYNDVLAMGGKASEAGNYTLGWKKNAVIEYFEPCKGRSYTGDVQMQIINDYSVHTAQKSFLLTDVSGLEGVQTSLEQFCGDEGSIVLQTNKRDNGYKVREYIAAELLKDEAVGTPDLSPCAVFVDGEYWGCYMLRRSYDAGYIADTYDVNAVDVQMYIKGASDDHEVQLQVEELYRYVVTTDMKDNVNFALVETQMDMKSYAEYLCANMYLANSEFGLEQWTIWRCTTENAAYGDNKWRWLMPEIDSSMANGMVSKLTDSRIDSYLMASFSQDYFIQSLLRNDDFCRLVQETMEEMMQSCFVYDNAAATIDEIAALMNKPATANYRRFFGYCEDSYFSSEIEKIKAFFMDRTEYMKVYTQELDEIRGVYVEQLPLVLEEELVE